MAAETGRLIDAASTESAGNVLAGRYRLSSLLGKGGMGLVYRACDLERRVDVAVKLLQRLDGQALYAFKNEFRALVDIQHPNLVRLGELIRDGEQWFFTMELVDGCDVVAYIRPDRLHESRGDPPGTTARVGAGFDEQRLRRSLLQLCDGLGALHRAGKVHRDIKPENVLVTREGRLVLLDFGLVADALATGRTEDGWIVGTPFYMAPEQAAQRPVGPAADWYGVGAILYEMLTGQPPFQGKLVDVLYRKQRELPVRPGELVAGVPEGLDRLCMDLMVLEPSERLSEDQVRSRLAAGEARTRAPGPSRVAAAPPAASPLIGRTVELSVLDDAFVASTREAVTVLVSGDSGVGKSALVRHFVGSLDLGEPPALILYGRCYERESVPYKALDGIVDALSRHLLRQDPVDAARLLPRHRDTVALLRIFPVLQRVPILSEIELGSGVAPDAQELRRQAFSGLREVLARLADHRRVVLVIDDLQWSDTDSLVLLEELLRLPGAPRVLLVATLRGQAPQLPGQVQEIVLHGLSPADGRELAEHLGASSEAAAALAAEAGGHPLFIQELVTGGAETGHLSLDEVLWSRIACLPADALETLHLIALAGVPLAPRHLSEATVVDSATFALRLGELRQGRLICTVGGGEEVAVECYHDRIRQTVLVHADDARRGPLHRRLAEVLERAGIGERQPDLVMLHLELGGEPARAAHYAVRAAAQADGALAFEQAVHFYRAALRLGGLSSQERDLRRSLAQALVNAGRGREAAQTFLEVAEGAPANESLDCRRRAAEQFLISGHTGEGLQSLRGVLAAVDIDLPRTPLRFLGALLGARARLRLRGLAFSERSASAIPADELTRIDMCWSATLGLSMIDPLQGALFQARHLLLALRAGEPARIARSLALETCHLASTAATSDCSRVLRLLDRARSLARALGQPYGLAFVDMAEGVMAYLAGRWRNSLQYLDRAGMLFRERCTGVAWEADTCAAFGIWSLWFRGEMTEMSGRLRRLVEEAEARGDLYASIALKTSLCNVAWLAEDNLVEAGLHVDQARQRWAVPGFQMQSYWILLAGAMFHVYAGDGRAAWTLMTGSWRPLARSRLLRVHLIDAQMVHMRAVAAVAAAREVDDTSERNGLLRAALRDARRLARKRIIGYPALGSLLRAGVEATRGNLTRAVWFLEQATAGLDSAEMALYSEAAKHRLGEIVGGDRGQTLLAEARASMICRGIRNPERMLQLLAPGFGLSDPVRR